MSWWINDSEDGWRYTDPGRRWAPKEPTAKEVAANNAVLAEHHRRMDERDVLKAASVDLLRSAVLDGSATLQASDRRLQMSNGKWSTPLFALGCTGHAHPWSGENHDGVVEVLAATDRGGGKWAYSEWTIHLARGLSLWRAACGVLEDLAGACPSVVRYSDVVSWDDVPEEARAAFRTLCRKTTERLDAKDAALRTGCDLGKGGTGQPG